MAGRQAATRLSRDYLMDFVTHLHRIAAGVIERVDFDRRTMIAQTRAGAAPY